MQQLGTFRIFCDLAESGSFSKAASANSITQSAVSQQIRSIEARFQVTLIDRGRRTFSLTPEGQAFLEASREILDVYDNLENRFQELQNVVAGDLRLASIYSIGLHELPPCLKVFRSQYPDVEVHVEYRRSAQVYGQVLAGEVDLGLVAFPAKRKGLSMEIFWRDRLVMICHPGHRLAGLPELRLPEINGEKFIAFEPDLPTRKVIDRNFREQRVAVNQVMEFDNIETVKRAVEIENGVSVVPENTVAQEVENGTLVAIPIRDPEIWRPLGIIFKRNRSRTPAQKEFISLLQRRFSPTPAGATGVACEL